MLIQSGVPRSSCTTLSFQCTCRCDAITTHDDEWLKHPGRFGNPFDKKNHHTRLPPEEGIEKTTLSSLAWARLSLSCCRASLARPSPACSRRNKARTTRASQRQEALASLLYRIHQATLDEGPAQTVLQPWSASWRTAHTWKRTRRQLHVRPCKLWRRERSNREQFHEALCRRQSKKDETTMWIAAANGDPGAELGATSAQADQPAFGQGSSSQRKQKPTKKRTRGRRVRSLVASLI